MSRGSKTAGSGLQQGPRRYASGESSREQILEAAERVLKRDGYHAFTTRRVADACGISVGNLTYYFPTKITLIEALMESVFDRYEKFADEVRSRSNAGRSGRVEELVAWLLRDAVATETTSLFLELWVMAKHHAFGAEALTKFYDRGVRAIADTLGEEFAMIPEKELLRVGRFLLTLSEGSTAIHGRVRDETVSHEEIIPLAVSAIEGLLERELLPSVG